MKGNQGDKPQDTLIVDSKPTKPNDGDNEDHNKSKSSTSNTGSADDNIADPFFLLELWDNITSMNTKVDTLDQKVEVLGIKHD